MVGSTKKAEHAYGRVSSENKIAGLPSCINVGSISTKSSNVRYRPRTSSVTWQAELIGA